MAARFDPQAFHDHPSPLVRHIERMRVRALGRLLRPRPGERLIEVGCGPGDVLLALARTAGAGQARSLLGLDLSPALLSRARQRLGPGVTLLRGNAEGLPLATGSLDGAVCSEMLEHTLRPEEVLRELARVLRPGGRVVVSIPEEERINRLKQRICAWGLGRLLGLTPAGERRPPGLPAAADRMPVGSGQDAPGGALPGYRMARRMDDAWHLHAFSLQLLRQHTPPGLRWARVVSIPSLLLPLRRVVLMVRS